MTIACVVFIADRYLTRLNFALVGEVHDIVELVEGLSDLADGLSEGFQVGL